MGALTNELHINKSRFPPQKKLVSIYWGGGTPSLFGPDRIKAFHESIRSELASMITDDCEITLEANPESVDFELLSLYHEAGINRLSFGVQSFHENELSLLGRSHTKNRIESVISWARKAGIENISIDLMYDLPHQSLDAWKASLHSAFSLPITHVSLYNLTIEPKTAFFRKKDELEKARPPEKVGLQMYEEAQKIALSYGFHQYEISAFARTPFHSRHNTGYWTGREFYGFGPSAYSFMGNCRFSNIADLPRYIDDMRSGEQKYEDIDSISEEARVRELFCVGLRLFTGISLDDLKKQYNVQDLSSDFTSALSYFEKTGLIESFHDEIQGKLYILTPRGRLVYDEIASDLI